MARRCHLKKVYVQTLPLTDFIHRDDQVILGQLAGVPSQLVEQLTEQSGRIAEFSIYAGILADEGTLARSIVDGGVRISGPGGMGGLRDFANVGRLAVIPARLSQIPQLLRGGIIRADVAFIHVSSSNRSGQHSLGAAADYMQAAVDTARAVVAEVNESMPFTHGDTLIDHRRFSARLDVSHPLPTLSPLPNDPLINRIAATVARFVRDGDTIELGFGTVPSLVARHLTGRRNLGIHTGLLTDELLDLIQMGVVTNAKKTIDKGVSVACLLAARASDRVYRWAHLNPALLVRSAQYVLADEVLGQIDNFCAINGAIEIDLSGQVNSETAGGTSVGGVGGLADFVHGALRSQGGRSIIALPSTARGGTVSRITAHLADGVVTIPRYDADVVVTEWGVAELRGRSLHERAAALTSIAHPDFRAALRDGTNSSSN